MTLLGTTMIQPSARHDMTSCSQLGRCARTVGTQVGSFGCAPGAPNLFLTQYTVWDIVHEHCSQKFFEKKIIIK